MTAADLLRRLFDADYYVEHNPDAPNDEAGAFDHYLTVGRSKRRSPTVLFDPIYYTDRYRDIGDADPLTHFLHYGEAEGRSPHRLFDPAFYVAQAPAARGRALAHFVMRGGARRLDPHPLFRSSLVGSALPDAVIPLVWYLRGGWRTVLRTHPLFEQRAYLESYADVAASDMEPLHHYLQNGEREYRNPCELFDVRYYYETNRDVWESGQSALLHYLALGYRELRDPSLRFKTAFYVDEHLGGEAAINPLIHYAEVGAAKKLAINPYMRFADFLPVGAPAQSHVPVDAHVDVIVPIYGGIDETQRCVESVLAAGLPAYARLVLIDDCSPDPLIADYVASFAGKPGVAVIRNERNLGFVATVNRGMRLDAASDVILLNSDTEVANDWIARLMRAAYGSPDIATVTPFTNNGTIAGFPRMPQPNRLPKGIRARDVDRLVAVTNNGRTVDLPTAVGFAMYIRRDALDDVGPFDEDTYGRGYGEENDFCLRATQRGWRHVLATDTFVYHEGGVSFSDESDPRKDGAMAILRSLYPNYERDVARHITRDRAAPYRSAAVLEALRASPLPTILFISHALGGGVQQHVVELVQTLERMANVLLLTPAPNGAIALRTLQAPFPFDVTLDPLRQYDALCNLLRASGVARVHIHHVIGLPLDAERLIADLGVPFDYTVHDFYAICPQVTLVDLTGTYCGEPDEVGCDACIRIRPNRLHLDIASWRARHAWLFVEADRVITPTHDTAHHLERYFPGASYAPHAHPDRRSVDFETRTPALSR